ncbi:hypothetical protein P0082_10520 [Candidatus Haliotispira prima]|uniref:Uncharacterized protein n=1 Tax=Candidatus Haliotispira prima TaxID=3034016 RepID=A0ABY8MH75_9SPIO|nr:hypothetical protein P0082_10520 [Candidatus Haliotispira prima]
MKCQKGLLTTNQLNSIISNIQYPISNIQYPYHFYNIYTNTFSFFTAQ